MIKTFTIKGRDYYRVYGSLSPFFYAAINVHRTTLLPRTFFFKRTLPENRELSTEKLRLIFRSHRREGDFDLGKNVKALEQPICGFIRYPTSGRNQTTLGLSNVWLPPNHMRTRLERIGWTSIREDAYIYIKLEKY